jgi:putative ABC transport system permease protein
VRSPIFTITAVATLAVGIGASTAMFSVLNAVLLKPLPYHEPDRLLEVFEVNPSEEKQAGVAPENFRDWQQRSQLLDLALFVVDGAPTVIGIGDGSVQARAAFVTPNLLTVLGVRPALGREFSAASVGGTGANSTEVILSHDFWRTAFAGDSAVLGRNVRIEGRPGTIIVGVMPSGFSFPSGIDFWIPIDASRTATQRNTRYARVVGRLMRGATLTAGRTELESIASTLSREYPETNAGWTVRLTALQETTNNDHRLGLLALFASTALVVLVGCANVSNLLLARGIARKGEIAVRRALGASRRQIVQLLLIESLALAIAAGAAGLALAYALMRVLVRLARRTVPAVAGADLNGTVLLYSLAASLTVAIVAGLLPAVRLSRSDQLSVGAAEERSTWPDTHLRQQHLIITGELALCVALSIGAMLFVRTFVALSRVELGFDPAHVISIDARFPMFRTTGRNRWHLVAHDTSAMLQRLRTTPGLEAVSAINFPPLSGTLVPANVTLAGEKRSRLAFYRNVTTGYFRTLGIQLVAGRDFTDADISYLARSTVPDARVREEGVVIVNESAARFFWPNDTALGHTLSTEYDPGISGRRVIGVVRDMRSAALRENNAPVEVYVPYLQDPSFAMTLLIRTRVPLAQVMPLIRNEIRQAAPDLSLANVRMLDDIVTDSMGSTPFTTLIVSAFAATALILSSIGVFSVFAFGVAMRTREIGIRLALGASASDVTRLFVNDAIRPIAAGVVIGTAIALAGAQILATLLFGITATDPVSFGAAITIVMAVSLAATYFPVRSALRVNPAVALRDV